MINLLPPSEKAILVQEKINRLIIILGVLVLLFLLCLSLILLSLKIYISGQVKAQEILVEQKKQSLTSDILNFEKKVRVINQNFQKLDSFYKTQPNLILLFQDISKTLPPGLYLNNFSLSPSSDKNYKFQVSISGYAPNREILLTFKQNLELQKNLKEIRFPSSNWLKPTDINFSATFKIK